MNQAGSPRASTGPVRRSRLDAFIDRMLAQRAALAWAGDEIRDLPGPILEIGLGNGRTYDHLRVNFPDREIWVFDRAIAPNPRSLPPLDRVLLGDLEDTLPVAATRFQETAVLAHIDIGTGIGRIDLVTAGLISSFVFDLVRAGGIVISDQRLTPPEGLADPVDLPGEAAGRHVYRRLPQLSGA